MCGIAGFVGEASDARALVDGMLARVAHRGPDGRGAWIGRRGPYTVALGHRRLSIIDLEGGVQPMATADEAHRITFNGEIYNFQALRPVLERAGCAFRTRSDTEVMLYQLAQRDLAGLADLNGMFAFAWWDARRGRLVLARDRAGVKPLYYAALPDGGVAFGSELSAVLAHPGVPRALSAAGLASYFFSDYVHPEHSMIEGVHKLPAGCYVEWENGKLGPATPFWRIPATRTVYDHDEDKLATELWSRLGDAVERQLIADVPVGIFLSGGLDSSSIATLAAERARDRLKAFSVGFTNRTFDESSHARAVAARIGVEHVEETLHEGNLLDIVDEALGHLDEPLADASYLPTYLLSRLAARHVKVVVGGDGGDELWGGYPTYRAHGYARLYARVPRLLRKGLVERAVHQLPIDERYQSLEWKLRRFTHRWDDDAQRRHVRWMSSVDLPDLAAAVPSAREALPATAALPHFSTGDWLNDLMALDFATYMSGSVLTKVDRASMAHGLEARPPFLDNELIDWSLSMPSRFKLRGQTGKYLFKRAARGHLPDEIIDRPKQGFGIPLAAWLRGPLAAPMEAVVARSRAWELGLLDQHTFASWLHEHRDRDADHSKPLWALYVLDRWLAKERL